MGQLGPAQSGISVETHSPSCGRARGRAAENCCFPPSLWSESRCPSPHPGGRAVRAGVSVPGAAGGGRWGRTWRGTWSSGRTGVGPPVPCCHRSEVAALLGVCRVLGVESTRSSTGVSVPALAGGRAHSFLRLESRKEHWPRRPSPVSGLAVAEIFLSPPFRPHPTYTPTKFKGRAQGVVVRLRLSELGDGGHSQKSGTVPF